MGVTYINPYGFAAFSPLDLSPILWFDAADATTITASSNAVSEWRDKSGNARHLLQSTAINQPTTNTNTQNGKNLLKFVSDDFMTFDAGSDALDLSPFTWFAIAKIESTAANAARVWSFRRSATGSYDFVVNAVGGRRGSTQEARWFSANTPTPIGSMPITYGTAFEFDGYSDGTNLGYAINGGALATTGASQPADARYFRVGGSCADTNNPPALGVEFLTGDIGELLFFNKTLTSSERSQVLSYLNSKWAVY